MEENSIEMTIESQRQKIDNQTKLIKELTTENDALYHQYNHLIIRNGKLLKRIDDFQKIIDDLHIRIEELQSVNGNMLNLNDQLRRRGSYSGVMNDKSTNEKVRSSEDIALEKIEMDFNLDDMYVRWKNHPGQVAQNGPNLRKQVLMLIYLYSESSLRAAELFNRCGVGGVTGARYVSTLKKFELIKFSGARKKGHYEITKNGIDFIQKSLSSNQRNNNNIQESKTETEKNSMNKTMTMSADVNDL